MSQPHKKVKVVKSSGEEVPFEPQKLRASLRRSGANEKEQELILQEVESKLFDGISTKVIYDLAYSRLKKEKAHRTAGRFKLKKAIFDLGPSGYPFEIFVGRLFESFGYQAQVGQMVQGKCIHHEVDVVAKKPGLTVIVETKFRSDFKGKTTVQVPLYINSRFADIKARWETETQDENAELRGFVVTNARFTTDAIKYSECVGLGLISWDYPEEKSLKYYIDLSGLHPLTSLHRLKPHEQKRLLESGIVLCRELEDNQQLLKQSGISDTRIKNILKEAEVLIS